MKFNRAIEYTLKNTLDELNRENINGLDVIINEIMDLKDSKIYEKMYNGSVRNKEIFSSDARLIETEKNQSNHLIALGFKELGKSPFFIPPFSSLISFNNLNALYSILVLICYAHAERELDMKTLRIYMLVDWTIE